MTTADLHTLTGAYAVNALSDLERIGFERHLGECDACRLEVGELQATAAHLGIAVRVEPSPRLRSAVLAGVTHTRQRPPHIAGRKAGRGRGQWIAWLVAAAAAVVSVVLGVQAISSDRQFPSAQQDHSVESVLTAPDAKTVTAPAGDGRTTAATVIVSRSQRRAVFLAGSLPVLDPQHVYQLWMVGDAANPSLRVPWSPISLSVPSMWPSLSNRLVVPVNPQARRSPPFT
ncbi:anti-sigma factor [Amycolatopsis plumensis]|uniref:Regulator of SigK n=1 Tax=Amycolatopsis plumensis TaxID=236508 RepID=A0ABV5UBB5_9PSEU